MSSSTAAHIERANDAILHHSLVCTCTAKLPTNMAFVYYIYSIEAYENGFCNINCLQKSSTADAGSKQAYISHN